MRELVMVHLPYHAGSRGLGGQLGDLPQLDLASSDKSDAGGSDSKVCTPDDPRGDGSPPVDPLPLGMTMEEFREWSAQLEKPMSKLASPLY